MKAFRKIFGCLSFGIALIFALSAHCEPLDPLDPTQNFWGRKPFGDSEDEIKDDDKSSDELLMDAGRLFQDERLLDGRTKLLKALKKNPKNYRVHMMLSGYYMQHVGYFRLALRYARQAEKLFTEQNGEPRYNNFITRAEHQQILNLIAQARLNLDDYEGALETLDTFESYGYYEEWYPGTRSWVLMKLGRLDEAIKLARLGVLSGAEQGRTLNMLGILLSMKGEREQSLKVFNQAIATELSMGKSGQPATPLNNSGEVQRELFEDEKAELAWSRSLKMPDGCEHVLPSLNLSLLYIDEANYKGVQDTMNNFLSCVAQFPLRNGEEHHALVALARGRALMRQGEIDQALPQLEDSLRNRQWFGKIGTDEEDLESGATMSLAQALEIKANHLSLTAHASLIESTQSLFEQAALRARSWWAMRQARQLLAGKLRDFEDFEIRFTDSLMEYSTLGDVVASLPTHTLRRKIEVSKQTDDRAGAVPYYQTYLAQNLLAHGDRREAASMAGEALRSLRPRFDKALGLRAREILIKSGTLAPSDAAIYAEGMYALTQAWLKNAGLSLPVRFEQVSADTQKLLESAGFSVSPLDEPRYHLSATTGADGTLTVVFKDTNRNIELKSSGANRVDVVNDLSHKVFSEGP